MSDLLCPACEFTLTLAELIDGDDPAAFRDHVSGHSTADWMKALAQADRYIELLEDQVDTLTATPMAALLPTTPLLSDSYAALPYQSAARRPHDPGFVAPPQSATDFGAGYVQPEARFDPNKTLIPHIPTGQRPEGVVGRKT